MSRASELSCKLHTLGRCNTQLWACFRNTRRNPGATSNIVCGVTTGFCVQPLTKLLCNWRATFVQLEEG